MEDLVQESKLGNEDASSKLYESVRDDLMKIARKYLKNEFDCEDAVQNAFEIAIQRLYKLRSNKYFKTWITRIVINECKKFYNSKNKKKIIEEVPLDELLCEYECFDLIDSNINFENLIGDLKDDEKRIYTLFHKYNYTIKDISLVLGINEGTIKSKLSRGKSKILNKIKHTSFLLFVLVFIVTGVIVASCVINYIKSLFSTHDIGKDNDGVLMAIENLEWFQDVDMNYVDLGDGYNLYLIFDFVSDKDIGKFNEMSITDLKITNENGEVICDRENIVVEQRNIHITSKLIENDKHHMKSLIYICTNKFPMSKNLNINFSKIVFSNKSLFSDNTYLDINTLATINIDLDEKFINRKSTYYTCENTSTIIKTMITETGFYSLIELPNINKLDNIVLLDNNNNSYKCYNISVNSSDIDKYQYMIVSAFNNANMNNLKLIINNLEFSLKKNN